MDNGSGSLGLRVQQEMKVAACLLCSEGVFTKTVVEKGGKNRKLLLTQVGSTDKKQKQGTTLEPLGICKLGGLSHPLKPFKK